MTMPSNDTPPEIPRIKPAALGSNIVGAGLDPPGVDWSARLLTLRLRLHSVMVEWAMAANSAPESQGATILSSVAVVLNSLSQSVEQADIALHREDGRERESVKKRGREAVAQLRRIEKAVRKVAGQPERSDQAHQARHLDALVAAHLAPLRGQLLSHSDRDDLARSFVRQVWGDRSMPIARQLTRRRLLQDPFDEKKVTAVREAFERIPPKPDDTHDSQRFIRAGLAALGFKDSKSRPA
jgi:hypothetical protein